MNEKERKKCSGSGSRIIYIFGHLQPDKDMRENLLEGLLIPNFLMNFSGCPQEDIGWELEYLSFSPVPATAVAQPHINRHK